MHFSVFENEIALFQKLKHAEISCQNCFHIPTECLVYPGVGPFLVFEGFQDLLWRSLGSVGKAYCVHVLACHPSKDCSVTKKKLNISISVTVFMIVKQFTTLYFDYGSTEINYFPGQYHGRKRIGRFPTHCSNLLIHMTIKSLLNFKDNLSFFLTNLPSLLLAWTLHVPVLCFTNHNTATNLAA